MKLIILNENLIIQDYIKHKSLKYVADLHKTYPKRIRNILKKHNILLPSTKEIASRFSFNKYKINEKYFETIDTEEKAYWLGFIAADGCITGRNILSIVLNSIDEELLLKFKQALSAEIPIHKRYNKTPVSKILNEYSCISIGNLKLTKDLESHGIIRKKLIV